MKKGALRDVRVLIVEDETIQLEDIKRNLELIPKEQRREWGINSFQSELAGSVKEVEDLLEAADSPFDILTLDLGLPDRKGEPDSTKNGLNLLERITKDKTKEVIIISVWDQYEYVINTIRKGAVDFISKAYFSPEVLQARVMEAWKRVLEQDSAHILRERIKELALYHERGLAYHYTVCFGKFVNSAHQKTGEIEEHLKERFGLNIKPGSDDLLIKSLEGLRGHIAETRQEWMKLQVPSLPKLPKEDAPTVEAINPILYALERELMPCLIVKNVRLKILPKSNPRIRIFQKDVQAVLREIISGLLSELPDYGTASLKNQSSNNRKKPYTQIIIEINTDNEYAQVRISDNLKIIPPEDAKLINDGSFTVSGERFSRVWGLAVMQHIAALGGGRLEIKSREQGNVVTFMIPLDSNA